MTPDTLKAWRARLSLGEAGMAAYLGVPVTTYRKWENCTRKPDAAPLRLFAVLGEVEDCAPELHARLIDMARLGNETGPPRPASPAPLPWHLQPLPRLLWGPNSHILGTIPAGTVVMLGQMMKANPPPRVHAAQALPDWMKSGA